MTGFLCEVRKRRKMPVRFVMFQGGRTNASACWQDGGFLPRLREVGDVFIYQHKLYNIFHGLPGFSDFPSDTEFDLDYLSPEAHLRGVYADVRRQFPRPRSSPSAGPRARTSHTRSLIGKRSRSTAGNSRRRSASVDLP